MRFYPGLTPDRIADLTLEQFYGYLGEIPELMAMLNGAEITTDDQIEKDLDAAEQAGHVRKPRFI